MIPSRFFTRWSPDASAPLARAPRCTVRPSGARRAAAGYGQAHRPIPGKEVEPYLSEEEMMQRIARGLAAGILASAATLAAPALAATCDTVPAGGSGTADGCQAVCKPDNPLYPSLIQQVKDD